MRALLIATLLLLIAPLAEAKCPSKAPAPTPEAKASAESAYRDALKLVAVGEGVHRALGEFRQSR